MLRIGLKDVSMLDEDVLHNEQRSQHVERGVELLPVHAEHVDKHVRDDTAEDAVGDAVRERHHHDGDERRYRLGIVVEVDVLHRREHEQAHDDEHRSGGSSRYGEEQRSEEHSHSEAHSRRERRETAASALRHACRTLHVSGSGACAEARASHGGYGISHERLVQTRYASVLLHHARLGAYAHERAHGVEHVDEEEGEHHHEHVEREDVVELELAEQRSHRRRCVYHAREVGYAHRYAYECCGEDADEQRARHVLDDEHRGEHYANHAEQCCAFGHGADGDEGGRTLDDDASVLQSDEGDEESDAGTYGTLHRCRYGVDDECAHLCQR